MAKAPSQSYLQDKIKQATCLLYPRARAFKLPIGGDFDRLHKALSISEAKLYREAMLILDSTIADSSNFTEDDASHWERVLAIYSGGSSVALADRVLAINRKIAHPGTTRPRQNWRYVEAQLQAAGFDVYLYENKFSDGSGGFITKTPSEIISAISGTGVHETATEHETGLEHGGVAIAKVANWIDEVEDEDFSIGSNYRSTFYIAGSTLTTFATIDIERKNEFRQLVLQLKPAQTVAFLFLNFT